MNVRPDRATYFFPGYIAERLILHSRACTAAAVCVRPAGAMPCFTYSYVGIEGIAYI